MSLGEKGGGDRKEVKDVLAYRTRAGSMWTPIGSHCQSLRSTGAFAVEGKNVVLLAPAILARVGRMIAIVFAASEWLEKRGMSEVAMLEMR